MTKQPKLLFVVNDAANFFSYRLPVASAARQAGFDVHVAAPEGVIKADIVKAGFTFHSIPLTRKGKNFLQELNSFMTLAFLYKKLQPDIVHHITIKPILYGGIAARMAHVPAVVNAVTGLGYVFITRGINASLLRSSVKQGYKVAFHHRNQRTIFQNPDDSSLFINGGIAPGENAVLIKGSGVDISTFTPYPESKGIPIVILASRMLWDKGIKEFVSAAKALRSNGIKARFVLVGDTDPGNPTAIPTGQLEAWRDSGVVEWWGWCADMPAVFADSHIVCLPSAYGEGIPKVLIEAASCGRAIVTTDAPGCREIVKHGENGLLVPVGDTKALTNALGKLIENPALREHMGIRGRDIVAAEFTHKQVVAKTLMVYRELLNGLKS